MTGILLITVAIAWLIAVLAATRWVVRRVNSPAMKVVSCLVLFPVLLVLPLADELVGKQQFDSLCKKYAVQVIDEKHAMNRRVVFVLPEHDQFVEGTALQIRIDPNVYRDAETNQVLVSYYTLHAKGGWFIRTLGISETNAPLLFESGCAPEEQDAFKKKFNITVIN
ncbi:MAG: hypothetical protein QFE16_00785 [Pseudomonadota bacterium]|nr:hypothetical protein [Pseudomonadota bacterium]